MSRFQCLTYRAIGTLFENEEQVKMIRFLIDYDEICYDSKIYLMHCKKKIHSIGNNTGIVV